MANKITLKSQDFNITSRKGNITLCEKHRISLYKKYYPKKSFVFSSSGSFLSYTVTSREFVCQIPFLLKVTVLREPVLSRKPFSLFMLIYLFDGIVYVGEGLKSYGGEGRCVFVAVTDKV